MAAKKDAGPSKPAPKATHVVCELCGLDWDMHGDDPTALTCIDLLKQELKSRPRQIQYATSKGATTYGKTFSPANLTNSA